MRRSLGELSEERTTELVETLKLCERVLRRKRALGWSRSAEVERVRAVVSEGYGSGVVRLP